MAVVLHDNVALGEREREKGKRKGEGSGRRESMGKREGEEGMEKGGNCSKSIQVDCLLFISFF